MKTRLFLAVLLSSASLTSAAEAPSLVLRIPGAADATVTVESLRKAKARDVAVQSEQGEAVTYRGVPLLDVLETGGLDIKSMAAERKSAPGVVVVVGRDGYTVVFSLGELAMHRSEPRVFLTGETVGGALPANQGPIRLIVPGQRARSAFALERIEVRLLAENKPHRT